MKYDPTQALLISTVNAHLQQLAGVSVHSADEASLRAISGTLRFLLVENNLLRAWRASGIGGPITLKTWCIDSFGPASPVVAFCGGGEILPGVPASIGRNARLCEKQLNLHDFCRSTRIQVDDIRISTVELIQYVANSMGGSHFDPLGKAARKPKGELLRRLEAGDFDAPGIRINDRSLLHHEILSVNQTILRSPEIAALRASKAKHKKAA